MGIVLRIETTCNEFKIHRDVHHRDGTTSRELAKMSKNIYSLFPLSGLLKACNRRYLEYISVFDDSSQGIRS
jgi:hypothetical protein